MVEDYAPFRQFIRNALANLPELEIVGEAADGPEALREAEKLQPDLILLDIGLPTLNGIAAARQIRRLAPKAKIIFVTQESSVDVMREAFNLGACGYVLKGRAETDLEAAIQAVLKGRKFISEGLPDAGSN